MADTKISALTAASTLDGTEPFPVVQSGTKKATGAQLLAYIRALLTDSDVPAAVITDVSALRTITNSDAGKYIRMTATGFKGLEFDSAVTLGEFHIRNAAASGDIEILATGVTLNPPAGGTLVLEPGMTVTVKFVGASEFDVFGQTVAA